MTNKRYTDEEIVRALECCISTTTGEACVGCPFNKQKVCDKDQWALERYALDLINRQKAELAENERLNKKVDKLSEVLSDTIKIRYKKAKAEAYKEFADRLKTYCKEIIKQKWNQKAAPVSWSHAYADFIDDVENLLKEMVGEKE